MADETKPTPLLVHTLDTLLQELISGRPVTLGDGEDVLQLADSEPRAILQWYVANRAKWPKNNKAVDVEAIVDAMNATPEVSDPLAAADSGGGAPVYDLSRVRIHRFAGTHMYLTPQNPPEDLTHAIHADFTVIQGQNGAGKSSLLSAIAWCLTGKAYRTQRQPEDMHGSMPLATVQPEVDDDAEQQYDVAPITPVPGQEVLRRLGSESVPLDTSVELTFVDRDSGDEVTVKRWLTRTAKGKIDERTSGFESLRIEPIARQIGTLMPAMIPYIQLEQPSDIGNAVANLTGFRALTDLVVHVRKSIDKLRGKLKQDKEAEVGAVDEQFRNERDALEQLIQRQHCMEWDADLPEPDHSNLDDQLLSLRQYFERLQQDAYSDATLALGPSFDPSNPADIDDIDSNAGPARGQLDPESLGRLTSLARLRSLTTLTEGNLGKASRLIDQLVSEAKELDALAQKPDLARRSQLYARIAGWLRHQGGPTETPADCPICQRPLQGVDDPVTGKLVTDHIADCIGRNTRHLETVLSDWQDAAVSRLRTSIAGVLSEESTKDLPAHPFDLITEALSNELFMATCFRGKLSCLKETARLLCSKARQALPDFREPPELDVPSSLDADSPVVAALSRASRAVHFAQWCHRNRAQCNEAYASVIGTRKETAPQPQLTDDSPLVARLEALHNMVTSAEPLHAALSHVERMESFARKRRGHTDRIALYTKCANAMDSLLALDEVVDMQVTTLMRRLSARTSDWKAKLYLPAFEGAPKTLSAAVGDGGSLVIDAKMQGTRASAYHVSNASDLRATLLAFVCAFWQHLLDKHGGLSMLLFDDIQEMFDPGNRDRLAATIPTLSRSGARPIVATNSSRFRKRLVSACKENVPRERIGQWRLHALRHHRPRIHLAPLSEVVDEKRREYEAKENINEPGPAIEYAQQLRIYLEAELGDVLDSDASSLRVAPTLADILSEIRRLCKRGVEPFTSPAFRNLADHPATRDNSPFLKLVNKVHHRTYDEITYTEVQAVAEDCKSVKKAVDAACEAYARWLRRTPLPAVASRPPAPHTVQPAPCLVPVFDNLAALGTQAGPGAPEITDERFGSELLTNNAIYYVNSSGLGFSAPKGSRVVVDLSDAEVPDQSLVVALHRGGVYARRLLRCDDLPGYVALAGEAPNPLHRRGTTTLFVPLSETRLLRVVGVLFEEGLPPRGDPNDEAVWLESAADLSGVRAAIRVTGESALPLVLPGQSILLGAPVAPQDLDGLAGLAMALDTTDGLALKRVGHSIPGSAAIRVFEPVGGMGQSLVLSLGRQYDASELPQLLAAWPALGVWYDSLLSAANESVDDES